MEITIVVIKKENKPCSLSKELEVTVSFKTDVANEDDVEALIEKTVKLWA
jgi:hypothetical protein